MPSDAADGSSIGTRTDMIADNDGTHNILDAPLVGSCRRDALCTAGHADQAVRSQTRVPRISKDGSGGGTRTPDTRIIRL